MVLRNNKLIITTGRSKGRLTQAQKTALDNAQDGLIIDYSLGFDWGGIFGNNNPIVCEIGFGDGECLVDLAELHPNYNFLGIDIYLPGVGSALVKINKLGLTNVRLINADVRLFWDAIAPGSFERIHVFFSDPWPKKRTHKRRLVNSDQIESWLAKVEVGGVIYIATDDASYQCYIDEQIKLLAINIGNTGWYLGNKEQFMPNQPVRPTTKYERRGYRLGHKVREWELVVK